MGQRGTPLGLEPLEPGRHKAKTPSAGGSRTKASNCQLIMWYDTHIIYMICVYSIIYIYMFLIYLFVYIYMIWYMIWYIWCWVTKATMQQQTSLAYPRISPCNLRFYVMIPRFTGDFGIWNLRTIQTIPGSLEKLKHRFLYRIFNHLPSGK